MENFPDLLNTRSAKVRAKCDRLGTIPQAPFPIHHATASSGLMDLFSFLPLKNSRIVDRTPGVRVEPPPPPRAPGDARLPCRCHGLAGISQQGPWSCGSSPCKVPQNVLKAMSKSSQYPRKDNQSQWLPDKSLPRFLRLKSCMQRSTTRLSKSSPSTCISKPLCSLPHLQLPIQLIALILP